VGSSSISLQRHKGNTILYKNAVFGLISFPILETGPRTFRVVLPESEIGPGNFRVAFPESEIGLGNFRVALPEQETGLGKIFAVLRALVESE
jgi:hypothetical protein